MPPLTRRQTALARAIGQSPLLPGLPAVVRRRYNPIAHPRDARGRFLSRDAVAARAAAAAVAAAAAAIALLENPREPSQTPPAPAPAPSPPAQFSPAPRSWLPEDVAGIKGEEEEEEVVIKQEQKEEQEQEEEQIPIKQEPQEQEQEDQDNNDLYEASEAGDISQRAVSGSEVDSEAERLWEENQRFVLAQHAHDRDEEEDAVVRGVFFQYGGNPNA